MHSGSTSSEVIHMGELKPPKLAAGFVDVTFLSKQLVDLPGTELFKVDDHYYYSQRRCFVWDPNLLTPIPPRKRTC